MLWGICVSSQVQPGMKLGKDWQNIRVVLVVELLTGGTEILLPRDIYAKCALKEGLKARLARCHHPWVVEYLEKQSFEEADESQDLRRMNLSSCLLQLLQ